MDRFAPRRVSTRAYRPDAPLSHSGQVGQVFRDAPGGESQKRKRRAGNWEPLSNQSDLSTGRVPRTGHEKLFAHGQALQEGRPLRREPPGIGAVFGPVDDSHESRLASRGKTGE